MSLEGTLGLDRVLATDELERVGEWVRNSQLASPEFTLRLISWFANFSKLSDKRLGGRLLVKFVYYSPTRFEQKLSDLGVTLSHAVMDNKDDILAATYIVDADHLDSSGSIAYHASKLDTWSINSEQVRTTSQLESPLASNGPFVVLNDTQGSGNQFKDKIWPHLAPHAKKGTRIYVACLELADEAARLIRGLSPNIVLVPDSPTPNCLSYLVASKYLSTEEADRIRELGARAYPPHPLGYGDCGLLSAYHYQCPNNTLAIFWGTGSAGHSKGKWNRLFTYKHKRKNKKARPNQESSSNDEGRFGAASPKSRPKPDLRKLIQGHDWIIGAMNFDEDLHFSSFYLRCSCKKYMAPEHVEYGYTSLVAVHQDFNETYYIRRDECIGVAEALLRKIKENPSWLQEVLDTIAIRAVELADVFPYEGDSTPFEEMATEQLVDIYRRHNHAHRRLYEVARIPEALDRGVGLFEKYLHDELIKKMGTSGADRRLVNAKFNILTFPETASQAHAELTDFRKLVREIQQAGQETAFTGSSKRTILKLDQKLRSKIARHRDKWSFWGYHGYGARTLLDLRYYLDRIALELTGNATDESMNYAKILEQAEEKRLRLFRELRIDENLALMFRLHSRVGLAKLTRRYYQLRNFYFLDQLLDLAARRLGVPEAFVRSLLPEELEGILDGSSQIQSELEQRIGHLVYVIDGLDEAVFGGEAKCTLADGLLTEDADEGAGGKQLVGTPISGGIARGRCKLIIRKEDATRVNFRPGDILVSESTDMDLYELIRESSGVITEAGGATCHAAIVCRELNKPAIVGVRNALKRLQNNDLVVLDANEGAITPSTNLKRKFTVEDGYVYAETAADCGEKARGLSRMLRAGVTVPRFFVIPWSGLWKEYLSAAPDAEGPALRTLSTEIAAALEHLNGEMFMIRSSMAGEDTEETASAGVWPSEAGVLRTDVVASLIRYIERIGSELDSQSGGSTIVQEMILGDASGVCFTEDPVHRDAKRLVLEAIPGGNELLTDGKVTPTRYFAARDTRELRVDEQSKQWGSLLDPSELRRLIDLFFEVEAVFGKPQDIEWTIKQGIVYILQSRPITTGAAGKAGRSQAAQRFIAPGPKDVSSLYSAYRVPPNLRLHLLRVAAFGEVIVANWKGPPLDRSRLITALLLHDIGNIVKADYDKFPDLFPEEMKNLAYWKAVQTWVRSKYGDDDVEASLAIAREINVSEDVLDLMAVKLFVRNAETAASSSWELKIAAYSDQRVGPHGVLPLEERFAEAKSRYRGVAYASVNRPEYEQLVRHAYNIEAQIDEQCEISLSDISDEAIQVAMKRLRSFEFKVMAAPGDTFH